MSELFEIPESKSPRLKWIEQHEVKTLLMKQDPEMWFPDMPWVAYTGEFNQDAPEEVFKMTSDFGVGANEDDAVMNWAIANKKTLWNEAHPK
jgi:hypothetical protein